MQIQLSQKENLIKELEIKKEKLQMLQKDKEQKEKEITHYTSHIKVLQDDIQKQKEEIEDHKFHNQQFSLLYKKASDTIQDLKEEKKQIIKKHDEINMKFGKLLDVLQEYNNVELLNKLQEILENSTDFIPKEDIKLDLQEDEQ